MAAQAPFRRSKRGNPSVGAFALDGFIKILTRRIEWLCELTAQSIWFAGKRVKTFLLSDHSSERPYFTGTSPIL
jgi:hypothetical protein